MRRFAMQIKPLTTPWPIRPPPGDPTGFTIFVAAVANSTTAKNEHTRHRIYRLTVTPFPILAPARVNISNWPAAQRSYWFYHFRLPRLSILRLRGPRVPRNSRTTRNTRNHRNPANPRNPRIYRAPRSPRGPKTCPITQRGRCK